jgi:hypothetical protein
MYKGPMGVLSRVFLDAHLHNTSNNTIRRAARRNTISARQEIGPIFDFFIFNTNFTHFSELHGHLSVSRSHIFLDAHLYNVLNYTIRQSVEQNLLSARQEIGPIFDFCVFHPHFGGTPREEGASNLSSDTATM